MDGSGLSLRGRVSSPVLLCALCVAFIAGIARAIPPLRSQAKASLLTKPWHEEAHWADTFDDILFFGETETKEADEDTQIFYWDSKGRFKFDREDSDPFVAMGYKVVTLDTDSDNSVLSGQLNDVAISPAFGIGNVTDAWRLELMGGAGSANDGHWSNGDSWYGIGAVNLETQLGETGQLHFGVYFDGNGNLWPDIPKPLVTYAQEVSERLQWAIGIPQTSIRYEPIDNLTIDVRYLLPVQVDAVVEYEFLENLRIGALYARTVEGFHLDDRNQRRLNVGDNRRLFHDMDRVGGGLRWITEYFDATLGAGYAFNHRFLTGYDIRDLKEYRELDGDWYVSLRLQGLF